MRIVGEINNTKVAYYTQQALQHTDMITFKQKASLNRLNDAFLSFKFLLYDTF